MTSTKARAERTHTRADTPASPQLQTGRRRSRRQWWPLLFLLPALLFYVYVMIVPSVQGAAFAFTDWDGLNPNWDWIGLSNFERLFNDPQAMRALRNTLLLALVTTIFENVIGLLLALAVNSRIKSRQALRIIFFAPVVIISVVVAFLWQFIYTPSGPINELLRSMGLDALAQNWLGNPDLALWSIGIIVIWQFSGYAMVIYLAGLQSVPGELLEAAALDGTNSWQRFWHVIRPLLAPAVTVNLMLSLIRGFMIFDQIWVTTQGGPAQSTNSLSTLVYRNAFQYGEYGYSNAIALVLTLLVALFGIFQYRFVLKRGRKA